MNLGLGILMVVAGGAMEGLFSLPVTRTPRWQWENTWGLGSLVALLLVPWPVALATIPELRQVYADVGPGVVGLTLLFGLGWGLGGIFWGKAIAAVGMALGVSLLMGLINVFGSPVPLAIKEPGKLVQPGGLVLLAAVGVMILGVAVCAAAGRMRQRDLGEQAAGGTVGSAFALGLLFCVVSGVLSAMVNVGFIFGEPIAEAAARHGAGAVAKNNAIWALVFTGNYLVNAMYALAVMVRRRTFSLIATGGSVRYWLWALFMGIAWPAGIILFGIGAGTMGRYGAFVAFPMMLVMAILFGNLAGILTGEWRGTSPRTRATMLAGVLVLFLAFGVFGLSSRLLGG
jgi:L-rhamnose-H+ transport protein